MVHPEATPAIPLRFRRYLVFNPSDYRTLALSTVSGRIFCPFRSVQTNRAA